MRALQKRISLDDSAKLELLLVKVIIPNIATLNSVDSILNIVLSVRLLEWLLTSQVSKSLIILLTLPH